MPTSIFNDVENPAYLYVDPIGEAPYTVALEGTNNLFVGSGSSCRIVFEGNKIEPIHCMLRFSDKRVLRVQDWNSESGTLINGESISDETAMLSGDELKIDQNRIVAVLSRDIHQRFTDRLTNSGNVSQMATEVLAPAAEPAVTETETEPEPQADKVATESAEKQSFHYDALADLDEKIDQEPVDSFGTDAIDVWDGGHQNNGSYQNPDESLNEEVELLRMEVDQLRFELAERDALLQSTDEEHGGIGSEEFDDDQTVQLVNRLEELLDELQSSDDRVRTLEELLQVSDQATHDEREERKQLESWVGEIEHRLSQRESESAAEMERLENQLDETKILHRQANARLKQVLQSKTEGEGGVSNELVQKLREQVELLQAQLDAASAENDRLRNEESRDQQESRTSDELREMEQKLLHLQVETSRERAEMSRQRAELERLREELKEKLDNTNKMGKADTRVEAMRQHLREIHQEEKLAQEAKRQRSLSGRISRLLTRVSR